MDMAVEPDDILLDVLYEEIDAESGEANGSLTPELLAELEGWREFRESLGTDFKVFEPSPSVRASILELAAKELNESVNEANADAAIRRPPAHQEKGSFWSKLAGQSSQIALVATVLLVGAFVMNFQKRDAPLTPSFEEVGYPSASLAPAIPSEGMAPQNEAESSLAVAVEEAKVVEPAPAPEPVELEERSAEQFARLAQAEEKMAPRKEASATPARTTSSKKSKPATRPKSSFSGDRLDLFDDIQADKSKREVASTSNRASAPTIAQPAAPSETLSKGAGMAMDEDQSLERKQESAPKKDVAPQVGSLDSLEAAYRARDYRRVITESQQVMESSATAVQRARALELRAQAYKQMGMLQQSMETYRNLEANYPTYQTERVRASRIEVERQLGSTPQPASKPRQQRSYDFEAESLNDSSK